MSWLQELYHHPYIAVSLSLEYNLLSMLLTTIFYNVIWNVIIFMMIIQIQSDFAIAIDISARHPINAIISKEVAGRICYHAVCQKHILKNKYSSLYRLKNKLNEKTKTLRIVSFGDSVMEGKYI